MPFKMDYIITLTQFKMGYACGFKKTVFYRSMQFEAVIKP